MNRITEAHIFVWRATPAIQCALRLFDSFNSEATKINYQFLINLTSFNCVKNLSFEKNQMFDIFRMARPVCSRLHFDLIRYFTQKPFIFENVVFAFLTKNKQTRMKNKSIPNTTKLLSI